MRTWVGVHLPQLILETHCPKWHANQAVVLRHDHVIAASPVAVNAGVRTGMRHGGVAALCPGASVLAYDAHTVALAMDKISHKLLQYTPELTHTNGTTFLLDVTASLTLFNGPRALCRRIRATLHELGFTARIATAPTAAGAGLLATHSPGRRRVLKPDSLTKCLDALPCACLPAAYPYLNWLDGIGCTTLGTMRKLPRPGLQRRTSKAVLQTLDSAYGKTPELFNWVTQPIEFSGHTELMTHIEHASAVLSVARHLVDQLCQWLVTHGRAVMRLELALKHEHGRHALPATCVSIALGVPTWQAKHLMHLLDERLHRLELAAPVIAVSLHTTATQEMAPQAHDLFPEPGGSPTDRRQLLERLVARLGRINLLQPSPIADHRPEVANHWVPIDVNVSKTACIQDAERPFWLLDRPLALSTQQHRPFYGSVLHVIRDPERIEDGWWAGLAVRDYFVARADNGARYWLFQERGGQGGWFLHGLFG